MLLQDCVAGPAVSRSQVSVLTIKRVTELRLPFDAFFLSDLVVPGSLFNLGSVAFLLGKRHLLRGNKEIYQGLTEECLTLKIAHRFCRVLNLPEHDESLASHFI